MTTILLVIHLVFVIALVVVILIQRSEGGALGIGGGGSGMGGMFSSRGAANLLTRLTAFLAAGFMATSLILTVLTSRQDRDGSILEEDQFDQQKEEFELEDEVQENTNNEESDNKPSVPDDAKTKK